MGSVWVWVVMRLLHGVAGLVLDRITLGIHLGLLVGQGLDRGHILIGD